MYTSINTFLFGGFGVFCAKIIVVMARVLILSIKFSFHSISGFYYSKIGYGRATSGVITQHEVKCTP